MPQVVSILAFTSDHMLSIVIFRVFGCLHILVGRTFFGVFVIAATLETWVALLSLSNGLHVGFVNGFVVHEIGEVFVKEEFCSFVWDNWVGVDQDNVFAVLFEDFRVVERIAGMENEELDFN